MSNTIRGVNCKHDGAEKYKVLYLYLSSRLDRRTECEAVRWLEGALPVQVLIVIHPSGVREVSREEHWEKEREGGRNRVRKKGSGLEIKGERS